MREDVFNFGPGQKLAGIFTYGADKKSFFGPCVVFLNAGLIHKIGPNRLYVKIARALASQGISSLRFDYSGLGDSIINSEGAYDTFKQDQIIQALDALNRRRGIEEFVLLGICSGADDAFSFATTDDRIIGLCLIDGVYQPEVPAEIERMATKACAFRYYKKYALSYVRWRKILSGKSHILSLKNIKAGFSLVIAIVRRFARFFFRSVVREQKKNWPEERSDLSSWVALFDRKVKVYLIFCEGDNSIDIFNLTIRRKLTPYINVAFCKFSVLKNVDHTFTPQWSQEMVSGTVVSWIAGAVKRTIEQPVDQVRNF